MTNRLFDWTVTIGGVDVSDLVKVGGTIDYGRSTAFTGFSAPIAVFEMFTETGFPNYTGTWPTIDLGDEVLIHTTWDGVTQWRRFTGVVQAIDWNPMEVRLTCAGNSADLATKTCGDTTSISVPSGIPRASESDLTRVVWFSEEIEDQGGPHINLVGTQGRWLNGIDGNTRGSNALEQLLDMASWCDALLMETRLGDVDYRARVRTRPTRYSLPATVVERDTIDMVKERGAVFNSVDVYYGDIDPTSGEQSRAYLIDNISAAAIGERRGEPIRTQLRYQVGAEGKGNRFILDNAEAWHAPDVTLLMSQTTDTQADAILDLEEGDPVRLGSLPTGAPVTQLDADIIGFTEIMHPSDYAITLHLSPGQPSSEEDDGNWIEDGLITGGDTTGTYTDADSRVWRYHAFTSASGTLTIDPSVYVVGRLLVIGGGANGGGGGGAGYSAGGGGSGSLYADDTFPILAATSPVTVTVGTAGNDSAYASIVALGGEPNSGSDGGDSGQGGTGGDPSKYHYHNGYPNPGGGQGGGGGGAGTSGSNRTGGTGYPSDITGASITYARGGDGGDFGVTGAAGATPGSGGGGGGYFFGGAGAGAAGTVVIAYRISPGGAGDGIAYDFDLPYNTGITYEEAN